MPCNSFSRTHRHLLLTGTSVFALMLATNPAWAGQALDALRSAGTVAASASTAAAAMASAQAAAAIQQQSQQNLARAVQVLKAAQAAQASARAAAQAVTSTVPDGLGVGGLNPGGGATIVAGGNSVGLSGTDPVSWQGVSSINQSTAQGQTTVVVKQTQEKALATWTTFNVGKNTTLYFDQSSGTTPGGSNNWLILNRVLDPNAAPSQILGTIKAEGGVLVINQNGIVFGGASQVNVHTLIASALDITNTMFATGLVAAPVQTPSASDTVFFCSGVCGTVSSETGARFVTDSGGRVLLLGGEVHHAGTISSPSGQALLAAGTSMKLYSSDNLIGYAVTATSASQPSGSTTGTVVNSGIIDVPTGNITLTGRYIEQRGVLVSTTSTSRRGSIILNAAEQTLNSWGITSRDAFMDGSVVFAAGSLTQILPDATDTAKITDDQVGYNSVLVAIGGTITVQGKTASADGAILQVKGYDALSKGNDKFAWMDLNRSTEGNPTTVEFKSGRVFLGDGSLIDVSGTTGAVVSASRNSIGMQLLASELADSPVLKDSRLYKSTIYFDASASGTTADGTSWIGTPLVPKSIVDKWIALKTQRSLEERMAGAGGIAVNSIKTGTSADFVSQAGATIDLSGGFVTYLPGFVKVTQLTTASGQTVSVSSSKATGDIAYMGIANSIVSKIHPRWGVTETWGSPLGFVATGYQSSGYVEGHDAGTLVLDVGTLIPGATIDAATVSGITQRTLAMAPKGAVLKIGYPVAPSTVNGPDRIPGTGSLSRIDVGADAAQIDLSSILQGDRLAPKVLANVNGVDVLVNPVKGADGSDLSGTAQLPAAWSTAGFSTYELNAQDLISVASNVRLDTGAGGSVALTANRIDIAGSVTAHGGTITLSAPRLGSSGAPSINLAATALLDASGLWTNDAVAGEAAPVVAVNGGTVTLSSEADIDLAAGSLIDVSAGGAVSAAGKATLGDAGSISLLVDVKRWYNDYTDVGGKSAAYLKLAGQLRGYGLSTGSKATKGGSLTISVPWTTITVRSAAEMNGLLLSQTDDSGAADLSRLTLSSDFFSANGFESISLTGRRFTVKGGTGGQTNDISAQAAVRYLANPTVIAGVGDLAASRLASDFATVGLLRPSKLSFQVKGDPLATGMADLSEALVVEDNAAIHVGAKGSINLTASQLVIIDGTLDAPAGTISVTGGTANLSAASNQGVWIGSTGRLLARGTTTRERLSDGTIFTDVLAGGTVTLNSLDTLSDQWIDHGGYVVLAPGSLVDVSGTTGPSSLAAAGSSVAGTTVGSAGGSITIRTRLGAALEGDAGTGAPCIQCGLLAKGGVGAAGGVLNLVEGYDGPTFVQTSARITLRSHTTNLVSTNHLTAGNRLDSALDPSGNVQFSISADSLAKGGFNSLSASFITLLNPGSSSAPLGLAPRVELEDGLALVLPGSLTFYASTLSYLAQGGGLDTGGASVKAGYIQWNGSEAKPAQASLGAGNVTLSAQLIDLVGDIALRNISKATFQAVNDIRLTGEIQTDSTSGARYYGGRLNAASSVTFRAAQIYPTTGSSYEINGGTLDPNGVVRFESNGNAASTPYSAGGSLYVYAPVIEQAGVVRAPLGTLALGCISDCPSYATPTTSLTVEPGSLTSVALAGGQIVPYGTIESSDGSWVFPIYDGTIGTAVYDSVKSAPPAKVIKLGGASINVKDDAVLEGSGGGELYGWEWIPGTGGTKDVFASTVGNSLPILNRYVDGNSGVFAATTAYAILPSHKSQVGIVDPVNSSLTPDVGKQVTISGVPGLADGTYTLLPARYAVLPGAYLVSVQTKPGSASVLTTATPQATYRQADGSYLTSGYLSTPFNGGSDEHWSILRVTPGASARRYSEIADSYASSFYAKAAAQNKTVVPRLAGDGGQMILKATNKLLFSGTGKFTVAEGGRGGMIDIVGDQIAVVTSADRDAGYAPAAPTGYNDPWNPIILAAGDLDKMGAESLLLGGTRITAADGIHVIASASGVVIDNKGSDGAAEALTMADLMLVAAPKATTTAISVGGLSIPVEAPLAGGGIVQVRDGSIIDTTGKTVTGGSDPIYLDGGVQHVFPAITRTTVKVGGVSVEYDYYTPQQISDYYHSARLSQGGFMRVSNGGYVETNRLSAYGTLPSDSISVGTWNGDDTTPPTLYNGALGGYTTHGDAVVGQASLKSDGLIVLSAVQDTRLSPRAAIRARALDLMSSAISLGTSDAAKPGLVLSQAMLDSLTGIKSLVLKSAGNITFYSALALGNRAADGTVLGAESQPLLETLVLDAAGIEAAPGAGEISLTARHVALRNSLNGTAPPALDQVAGATLSIEARDLLGETPDGIVNTGSARFNAGRISFGAGALGIAGFSSVNMKSSGVIAFEADGGKLTVQSALRLDAPMITGGSLDTRGALPKFNQASYSVTASDLKAAPAYYRVDFINSATPSPLALPVALLGNSLDVTAKGVVIDSRIAMPGGAFKVTAKNGDVVLGDNAVIDAGGAAVVFRDAIATSGGGTIALVSETGGVSVGAGARINVGTVVRDGNGAVVSTLTDAEAGTLVLSAANGTASIRGHLSGEGGSVDKGGTIFVDARTIDTDGVANGNDYDGLAAKLGAAGFTKSWTIRARTGDIAIGGTGTAASPAVSKVRNLTVGADAGDITLSQYGRIDASGATGGKVALWAGRNLSVLGAIDAHGVAVDAAGKGGQVTLAAGTTDDSGALAVASGASIDVSAHQAANTTDNTKATVLAATDDTGTITLQAPRTASGLDLNITGLHGTLKGAAEIVVVGNKVYGGVSTLTPTVMNTYLAEANTFMGGADSANEHAIKDRLVSIGLNAAYKNTSLHIRPGIEIRNPGDIAVRGDSLNWAGIDLSGTWYTGASDTAYYTAADYARYQGYNVSGALKGHFGEREEPVALTIRAGGNLNFGTCANGCTSAAQLTVGSLSDGFSASGLTSYGYRGTSASTVTVGTGSKTFTTQAGLNLATGQLITAVSADGTLALIGATVTSYNSATGALTVSVPNGTTVSPSYVGDLNASGKSWLIYATVTDAGASGQATLFAAPDRAGTDAPDSATFRLTAGADLSAANVMAIDRTAAGSVVVAGVPTAKPTLFLINGALNDSGKGGASSAGNNRWDVNLPYLIQASQVRTGTGDIDIAAAANLVLQGAQSVVYTAGTTRNVGGTSAQPLAGFTQYTGQLKVAFSTIGQSPSSKMLLSQAAFGVRGGDVGIAVEGDVTGANSAGYTYELLGMGSQVQLDFNANPLSFSLAYKTGSTRAGLYRQETYLGYRQLAWYAMPEYFAEGIGALGGGNLSIRAGGSVSNVVLALPTNARDAGDSLTASVYDAASQTGLYVQGGGSLSVKAGGDVTGVNTYVQLGSTSIAAAGSVKPNAIVTGTGEVALSAGGNIVLADYTINNAHVSQFTVSSLSIAQNSSMLGAARTNWGTVTGNIPSQDNSQQSKYHMWDVTDTLQGMATSVPDGMVSLSAVGSITLSVGEIAKGTSQRATKWSDIQGILPAGLRAVSLQGDIVNNKRFVTWPSATGTVDLMARGSVTLNNGFTLSDAQPAIMPTLTDTVNAMIAAGASATTYARPIYNSTGPSRVGGAVYTAGGDAGYAYLEKERYNTGSTDETTLNALDKLIVHASGLHGEQSDPARVYALTGDIVQATDREPGDMGNVTYEILAKASSFYAGRDIVGLILLGQNDLARDVTSIVAGRDVIYRPERDPVSGLLTARYSLQQIAAIRLAGPGDLFVAAGRDVNLGMSEGLVTIGNILNPNLPSQTKGNGQGAGITVMAGTDIDTLNYAAFLGAFVAPASSAASLYREGLTLVDASGANLSGDVYAWLMGLGESKRDVLLNRLFFDLVRDSGREHTGASTRDNYQAGYDAVDTVAGTGSGYVNYERAYAAIASLLGGTSGSGDFKGVFSRVRTTAGGDITIIAPNGSISVGAAALPAGFNYGGSTASGYGVVTEQGGSVRMYADRDILVNQSRIFTLNGGDITLVSRHGNIDAGKGAKTVQSIQPATVSYDVDGFVTITPIGASSGSGIAVLRSLPTTPEGNADLIAFEGAVDAGDAGIRVSGNLNIAATQVLNAFNISVGGSATGVPMAAATGVNLGALTATDAAGQSSGAAEAAARSSRQTGSRASDMPSIITVEVIGYGGAGSDDGAPQQRHQEEERQRQLREQHGYNSNSEVQFLGLGKLTADEERQLTETERQNLKKKY